MTSDGLAFTGVVRLSGTSSFPEWYLTIELYARVSGCHRTLFGHYEEPMHGTRGVGCKHAGDAPPTPHNGRSPTASQLDEWREWSLMESKAQALVRRTITPNIESLLASRWSANDMLSLIKDVYGGEVSKEDVSSRWGPKAAAHMSVLTLHLPDDATPEQMSAHKKEFEARAEEYDSHLPAYTERERCHYFKQSFSNDLHFEMITWGNSNPTWDLLVTWYDRVMEKRKPKPEPTPIYGRSRYNQRR